MSDREPLTPELKAVEAALSGLVPMPATAADRDRLMFVAGRAAGRSQRSWAWSAATAATVLAALIIGRQTAPQLANAPAPQIAQSITIEPDADAFVAANSPTSYLQLRRNLERFDVADVGPAPSAAASRPTSHQALLHELLN